MYIALEESYIKDIGKNFYNASLKGECHKSSAYVSDLCNRLKYKRSLKIACKQFDTDSYPELNLSHEFCIVRIETEEKVRSFIVDCTYRQFFARSNMAKANAKKRLRVYPFLDKKFGKFMLKNNLRRSTAIKLLKQGYAEVTDEIEEKEHNLENYTDSFIRVSEDLRKRYGKITSEDYKALIKSIFELDIEAFVQEGRDNRRKVSRMI